MDNDPYAEYFGHEPGWVLVRLKRAWVPDWTWSAVAHWVSPARWLSRPVRDDEDFAVSWRDLGR